MSKIVKFPDMNPIRFYEQDSLFPDLWGFPAFGKALLKDSVKPNQVYEEWLQPVTPDMTICFCMDRGRMGTYGWNFSIIRFLDSNGQYITYLDPALQGDYITDENGELLLNQKWQFKIGDIGALAGKDIIQIQIQVVFGTGVDIDHGSSRYFISNPLSVAAKHDNTFFMEYNNNTNDYKVLFEQLKPRFQVLVPTFKGLTYMAAGTFEVFTEQDGRTVKSFGQSTNQYKADIGGVIGVPDYFIDTLQEALKCDNKRIGGRLYDLVNEELQIEGREDGFLQRRYAILQDKGDIFTFPQNKILGWIRPTSGFPYALEHSQITDGFSVFGSGQKAFFSSTDEDNLISANNSTLTTFGYSGQWVKETDGGIVRFYFVNAEGERFDMNGVPDVFNRRLKLTLNVLTANDNLRYYLGYPTNSIQYKHVACYADATGTEELWYNSIGSYDTIVNHTFGTTGAKLVNIFTKDQEVSLRSIHGSACPVEIKDWSNNLPSSIIQVYFLAHPFNGSAKLSLTPLQSCEKKLVNVTFRSCGMTGIATGWASGIVVGTYKGFAKVQGYEFSGGALTTSDVDSFINEVWNSTNYLTYTPGKPYVLDVSGNSPTAAPSGTSSAARTGTGSLDYYGWNIFTD